MTPARSSASSGGVISTLEILLVGLWVRSGEGRLSRSASMVWRCWTLSRIVRSTEWTWKHFNLRQKKNLSTIKTEIQKPITRVFAILWSRLEGGDTKHNLTNFGRQPECCEDHKCWRYAMNASPCPPASTSLSLAARTQTASSSRHNCVCRPKSSLK
jgi:hypothetical protein